MIYYLATNKTDIFHFGSYDPNINEVATGQPYFLEFNTKEELINELEKHTIDFDVTDIE